MQIGPHRLPDPVILAPMAGVTDLPYRNLCRSLGAGAAVAEMLTSNQSLWHSRKSGQRRVRADEPGLRWIQILGNDPDAMADAARACEQQGADIIDINLGCPAKKVCRKAAGSALLADEARVASILSAVTGAVTVPVTLKTRTGYSRGERNLPRIARLAEDCGIAALTVHGRTRECRYDTAAEHDTLAAVRAAVRLPLVVNGDIATLEQARHALRHTGADAVMIGRAALGNPWLLRQVGEYLRSGKTPDAPTQDEVLATVVWHVASLHEFYGEYLGLRIARKHVGWYEQQFPQWLSLRAVFNAGDSAEAQLALLAECRERAGSACR